METFSLLYRANLEIFIHYTNITIYVFLNIFLHYIFILLEKFLRRNCLTTNLSTETAAYRLSESRNHTMIR